MNIAYKFLLHEVDRLTSELAESQRKEKAAARELCEEATPGPWEASGLIGSMSSRSCQRRKGSGMIEVPMSNGDKIRAMNDEELADWLEWGCVEALNSPEPTGGWIDWLRQEANDA